jgi:hypothetical protein
MSPRRNEAVDVAPRIARTTPVSREVLIAFGLHYVETRLRAFSNRVN